MVPGSTLMLTRSFAKTAPNVFSDVSQFEHLI